MSHLRFYLAILSHECATLSRDKVVDAATVTLHAATLLHKQTQLLHHFSVSRSSFTDKVPKWWNCSMPNLSWTHRLIVRFLFERQLTKTWLLPRISQLVMLLLFVYATKSQRATAQSRAATLSRSKGPLCVIASPYQISSKSVKRLQRYADLTVFRMAELLLHM